ncbi:MAG: hypothetical protein WC684_03345 [Hyphomicrobium sp.]|jgi:hypothetical protein
MTHPQTSYSQRSRGSRLSAALLSLIAITAAVPALGAEAIVKRGDAAVTGFSGAKVWGKVPKDVSPTDVTYLDTGGAVLRVFDLEKLGGPPTGALANAPSTYEATAGDIGQVFGVTLDSETANRIPNIYVTATSLFGLQIVSKEGTRLVNGERGARWMPGQFGEPKGGGPGSVWKIDGVSGAISLFANLKFDGKDNAGPGLGNVAYDPVTKQLFVTDLEFGLIHRLGIDGSIRGSFDHGIAARSKVGLEPITYDAARRMGIERPEFNVEEPSTWGFADARRRVFAVAVQDGRVYYSVGKPVQIWSVGLNADGGFADDARAEFDIKDTTNDNVVTDIVFDGPETMYLSQRGGLTGSYDYSIFAKLEKPVVRRYAWNAGEQAWSEDVGEFAVGFMLPHRSTLGGLALSYGYDADGNINYGKCRETLWTTGEHLREGADKKRDYKGGARVVHGLQATAKGNVRPANAPPYETWFVDNDGQFDDADFYSRVGDIAIYDPCDEVVAATPEPPLSPPLVPLPPSGIWIKKVCTPAPFGGPIHCTITVTNSSGSMPEAPVTLWDAATILAGPGAGGAVTVTAVVPDIAQWFCSPTPTANLSCTLAPEWLPPGASHSIDVTVDTAPLLAAGNHGFRNCAVLGAPWYGEACAEGGTQLTVVKTAPAACAPGGDCTFGITITNTGSLPFSGDVVLSDSMFMGAGVPLPAPITAIVPLLGCAPAPGAVPFSCTAPLTLAAGAAQQFDITATMPMGAPPGYWARNCIAISAPGVPPPALPPAAPIPSNVSCAWVPVGAPLPLNNLRLSKTALHAGKCAKAPGDIILCDYEISVINDGPSPYAGMLTLSETVPAASTLTVVDPTWACAGGPPVYACNTLAAVNIAVGDKIVLALQVSIPLAPLEAGGCTLPNTAAIVAPAAGTDANFDASDDDDTALADAFLSWVDIFGVLQVTCDPTNMKTTKLSKGDCVASGDNFRCEYTVTVTNTGPDPYHGPLKVSEQLGFAPTSVAFSAPWGCPGGGASYQCTHPHVDMVKGDSVELGVTVNVPGGRQCELINRAATIFPVAGTRYNNVAGDDLAVATARIPAKSCDKPERPQCEPGANELRSSSGACVCKTGFMRDDSHACVRIIAEPQLCPDGKPVPRNGRCPSVTPQCEPGPGEYRNDDGRCVCKRGLERNARGRCVEEPTPQCELGRNEYRDDNGDCVCKRGFERDGKGRCVEKPTPQCEPGPNEYRDDNGNCVCKRGFERDGKGRCVEKTTPQCELGRNEYRDDNGNCVCKRGFERDGKGRCVEKTSPADDCRKQGKVWDGTRCIDQTSPADDCRKKGWTWTGKRCVEPTSPADDCRKQGKIWDGKRCIDQTSPADACRKKGWTWTGKRCVEPTSKPCPSGTTGTPPNCKPVVKPKCPAGMIGSPPNCKSVVKPKCPSGTVGSPPNCKPIVKPKCPRGTTGTFPNCKQVPS